MASSEDKSRLDTSAVNVQPVYVTVAPPSDEGIDLVELWVTLWRGKWLILGITIIFAVAAIFYSLSITPVYRAEVVLAPASQSQANGGLAGLGGLASLAGIRLNTDSTNERALAVLESKRFAAEFIQDNNLLPVLFPEEWDAKNKRWINNDTEAPRDLRDGVRVFGKNIRSVSEDKQTGLVTLAIEWTDPEITAFWANELVRRINERMRHQDIEEAQRKLDYLREQLDQASLVELRLAISNVIEEQISAMMLAKSQIEYAFDVIDPAVVPKQRIRPKRTLIVIVGTLLGGLVGAFTLIATFAIKNLTTRAAARNAE